MRDLNPEEFLGFGGRGAAFLRIQDTSASDGVYCPALLIGTRKP